MLEIVHGSMEHWPEIERVLSRVWEDDYVPESWRYWIEHPEEGMTPVALWDGHAVGTCHIAYHGSETAWFQGLRIDPDFQGRGIARAMNQFNLAELRKKGVRRCLAAIDSDNLPSQKTTGRSGFQHIYSYEALAPQQETPPHSVETIWQKAPLSEADVYLAALKPHLRYPRDLVMLGWELNSPETETIKEALCFDERCFLRSWSSATAQAWAAIYDFDVDTLVMSPACTSSEEWPDALRSLEATMCQEEKTLYIWLTPDDPLYKSTLAAGYQVCPDHGYQIWQLLLN